MKQTLDLDKFNSKDPKVKYGFAKELLKLGKDSPSLLYDSCRAWSFRLLTSKFHA